MNFMKFSRNLHFVKIPGYFQVLETNLKIPCFPGFPGRWEVGTMYILVTTLMSHSNRTQVKVSCKLKCNHFTSSCPTANELMSINYQKLRCSSKYIVHNSDRHTTYESALHKKGLF